VEAHLITPLFMKEGVDLPPALTLVAQALFAAVFGLIGLLVAVPLLAAVMVPIKMLYVEGVVGDAMVLPASRGGGAESASMPGNGGPGDG
jgi:predicted PurR-regulated permease PerM